MRLVVLIILLALIGLIFFVPYGVDAAYEGGEFSLRVKAGPLRIRLLPKKPLTEKQQERARKKKEKKEAKKKAAEEKKAREEQEPHGKSETIKVKEKKPLDLQLILALLKMGAHAIRRFFRSFSIDFFKLHAVAAGPDPYNTALEYGAACSAVEALSAQKGGVIRVGRKDIELGADFTADKPTVDVRIVLTLQLFKLVHMLFAFAAEFIVWKIKNSREAPAAAIERTEDNGRQQDQ